MTEKSGKPGRPRIEVDWRQVDELCRIQCTAAEIAAVMGISDDTLSARCKEDHGIHFSEYIRSKRLVGNASLRRAQFKAALRGNTGLLIWLGKQFLEQTDKIFTPPENENRPPIQLGYDTKRLPISERKETIDVEHTEEPVEKDYRQKPREPGGPRPKRKSGDSKN